MSVLAADVGGTNIRVGIMGADGARVLGPEIPVFRETSDLVAQLFMQWEELSASLAEADRKVQGAVVALPGRTDRHVLQWIPNLPFLNDQPFAELLSRRLNISVSQCQLINDGQAALVAEEREGAAVGKRNVILVAIGTGIGGAMIINGHLVRGMHGSSGSFGWLNVGDVCPKNDSGPWEIVASGTALDKLTEHLGGAHAAVLAAREEDPAALQVISDYAVELGKGLGALASIIDPDIVLIGGGLSAAFDVLEKPLKAAVSRFASPVVFDTPIAPTNLGPQAGLLGALNLAQDLRTSYDQ